MVTRKLLLLSVLYIFTAAAHQRAVMIYHIIGRGGTLESIKAHGLLSRAQAARQLLIKETLAHGGLKDQHYNIYFNPLCLPGLDSSKTVGFYVNPETTFVYNRAFRFDGDQAHYRKSQTLLSAYLACMDKATAMKKERKPGNAIRFHPWSAEPFFASTNDPRSDHTIQRPGNILRASHYDFLAEVILTRHSIPATNLVFFRDENELSPHPFYRR